MIFEVLTHAKQIQGGSILTSSPSFRDRVPGRLIGVYRLIGFTGFVVVVRAVVVVG